MAGRIEAHYVVAVLVPRRYQSSVCRDSYVIKAPAGRIFQLAQEFACPTFVTRNDTTLGDVYDAAAIGSHSSQRHFPINAPLRDELALRVEHLDAPAAVFTDVDLSRGVYRNAACILEHARTDSFRAKVEHWSCKCIALHFVVQTRTAGSLGRNHLSGGYRIRATEQRHENREDKYYPRHRKDGNYYKQPGPVRRLSACH